MSTSPPVRLAGATDCLLLLAGLLGLNPDSPPPESAPSPADRAGARRYAQTLGLDARWVRRDWPALVRTPLPALVCLAGDRYAVLAARDDQRVLLQVPGEPPATLSRVAFLERWTGELLLAAPRAQNAAAAPGAQPWWLALRAERRLLGEVLAASLVVQTLGLASPVCFQLVIDKVLAHHRLATLDVLCAGLAGAAVFESLLGGLRNLLLGRIACRLDLRLGAQVFGHLLRLPLAWFESRRTGETVSRLRELEQVRSFLTGPALGVGLDVLFAGVFLALLTGYSPWLAGLVALGVLAQAALVLLCTPLLRHRLDERHASHGAAQSFLTETVNAMPTVKSVAAERGFLARWETLQGTTAEHSRRAAQLTELAGQGVSLLQKLVTVATLYCGARAVLDGALSVGALVAFNMVAARVAQPVLRLAQAWQEFQQTRGSLRRLDELLHTPVETGSTTLPQTALRGAVRFERVSFRYRPEAAPALSAVDFTVPAGGVLGLVGVSGSGKSTLAGLMQRLHAPQAGHIRLDGHDLATLDPGWLRRQVGVVPQDCRLFNRSVRDNIALQDPALPLSAVIEAARLAGAHDFILRLPAGYDTLLGEHGVGLSGGQRQRLALARALVTEPRLLILDEATSALDYATEAALLARLPLIAAGRSVWIIAHRLSAVREANRILVLEQGRIVQDGTHTALLAVPGAYRSLWRLQSTDVPAGNGWTDARSRA